MSIKEWSHNPIPGQATLDEQTTLDEGEGVNMGEEKDKDKVEVAADKVTDDKERDRMLAIRSQAMNFALGFRQMGNGSMNDVIGNAAKIADFLNNGTIPNSTGEIHRL